MVISIDPETYVIFIPQSELTFIGGVSYQLDTNAFRIALRDWEDGEDGIYQPNTHNHNTTVLLGGIQYSRVLEILSPYTITFEETGTPYSVSLTGSNNNILEKTNLGTVQILSNNSAGLINVTEVQTGIFQGGVWVDPINGIDGIAYPAGTPLNPVQTCDIAMQIAAARSFKTIYFLNDFTMADHTMSGYNVIGLNNRQTTLTIGSNLLWQGGMISDCKVQGTFVNGSFVIIRDAEIGNLGNISLDAKSCILSGTIELNNGISSNLYNCMDGVPGSGIPTIQVNDCESLGIWNYAGGIKLTNIVTVGTNISFNAPSGRLIVDSSDTQGSIVARGVGSITGTTGGTTITQTDLINRDTISDSVWDELTTEHTTAGTTGKALADAGASGNPWGSPVVGNTAAGTFGELVGKKLLTVAKFLGLK